ncbi:hypothetical protein [Nostoc sp. KVJ3]|nr:hypothetical protein [Nostoc sp. KVJ3]
MIKYHSNHFDVPSLAHNKKKAIQELSEQIIAKTTTPSQLRI